MKKTMKFLCLGMAASLAGSVAFTTTPDTSARAGDSEQPIHTALSSDFAAITDDAGVPVSVIDDDSDVGEKSALVQTSDGTLGRVIIQSSRPFDEIPETPPLEPSNKGTGMPVEGVDYTTSVGDAPTITSGYFDTNEVGTVEEASLKTSSVTAITASSVSFSWAEAPGIDEYTVIRNGVEVGRTFSPEFAESGLSSATDYMYEITGLGNEEDSSGNVQSYTRIEPITTLNGSEGAGRNLAPMTDQTYGTAFIYKTFITNNKVKVDALEGAVCDADPGNYFGGDDRSFLTPGPGAPYDTPSYRTMAFLAADWSQPAPYNLQWLKGVGVTKKYVGTSLVATRTAADNGIVFQNPRMSGNYVNFGVSHEVGNPFCALGGIRYSLTNVEMYKSGTVSILGSRQPVPAHEAYARFSNALGNEIWRSLYVGTQGSFACISGFCPSENINRTISY